MRSGYSAILLSASIPVIWARLTFSSAIKLSLCSLFDHANTSRLSCKTNAIPEDDEVAIGTPGLFIPDDIPEIHISVVFTWDLLEAEIRADACSHYSNIKIGDPATGMRCEAFTPSMYLKIDYIALLQEKAVGLTIVSIFYIYSRVSELNHFLSFICVSLNF